MPHELPFVSCLCPTYLRPKLLENSLACYLAQDYPADCRELLILDDAGQLTPQRGDGWEVISVARRFRSLPEKFNALAGLARGDVLVVWEDDDIYLPWHLTAHVDALTNGGVSKPSRVLSLYTGTLQEEAASGRFHASIAFTRKTFETAGGWPLTQRGDFDQQFLTRLSQAATTVDPCHTYPPSYIFRWGTTHSYHGQGLMQTASDTQWYDRVQLHHPATLVCPTLSPSFDDETAQVVTSGQ
ncbi:MAG: glycosyltransferase family 2 protein [Planctomycetaceae bacterium]|nr:glycosyltransferase family 2 protein [Planctomycetaceae bacterium]MCA9112427.1 glycosyltransferase family 2 protein [Planctomycetaceae bacterium]